jgi:hypothetical protein
VSVKLSNFMTRWWIVKILCNGKVVIDSLLFGVLQFSSNDLDVWSFSRISNRLSESSGSAQFASIRDERKQQTRKVPKILGHV